MEKAHLFLPVNGSRCQPAKDSESRAVAQSKLYVLATTRVPDNARDEQSNTT